MVYWASNLYDNTDENSRKQLTYNRMVYVTTDDFVNFSDRQCGLTLIAEVVQAVDPSM